MAATMPAYASERGEMAIDGDAGYVNDMPVAEAAPAMDMEVAAEAPIDMPSTGGAATGGLGGAGLVVQQSDDSRKFVINVDLGLQTMEFDAGVGQLKTLTEQVGGYIQNSYAQGSGIGEEYFSRSANYTVRIPVDRLNEFLEAVSGSFNVTHQSQSSSDITMSYYDTEARLKSLRVQEERLLAMLEESGDLEYMLKVEKELADVLFEIEQYTSSLNRMDDSVELATVTMNLYEVVEYENLDPEPATFGQRIGDAFGESWENFKGFCEGALLVLIALLPFLPVIAVIVVVIVLLVKRSNKRMDALRAAYYPPENTPAQPAQDDAEKPEDTPEK
jgi:hypothetical protein